MRVSKITAFQRGLKFIHGEFAGVLKPGLHLSLPGRQVDVIDVRECELQHEKMEFLWRGREKASALKVIKVKQGEMALLCLNGQLEKLLKPGVHAYWTVFDDVEVNTYKVGKHFAHAEIENMSRRAADFPQLEFIETADNQRALVSINGHFYGVFSASIIAFWRQDNNIEIEYVSVNESFFTHQRLGEILKSPSAATQLEKFEVKPGQLALVYMDGKLVKEAKEGLYAYWRNTCNVEVQVLDLREKTLEINGQEIMTSDKVSLRINALVTYNVENPVKAMQEFQDYESGLYKEAQMILRSALGSRDLDTLLSDKVSLETLVHKSIVAAGKQMGLKVRGLGLKDIILPGDMKELLNKVTEARKAAEASLITRREETASMRSQANTARIMESNPILMKLRELELVEKFAAQTSLTLIAGDKSLADSMRTLL